MRKLALKGTLALLLCVLFFAPALAETDNLIKNGSFEQVDANGAAEAWRTEAWVNGLEYTLFRVADEGYTGGHSVFIQNDQPNDARFVQRVKVEPSTCYRISCYIKADGIGEGQNGAGISVADTFVSSPFEYDTNGEWRKVTLVGMTAEDQTELNILARLGGYGSVNTGKAWFDDITVESVIDSLVDEPIESFATVEPKSNVNDSAAEDEADTGSFQRLLLILIGLLFAGACALMISMVETGRLRVPFEGRYQLLRSVTLVLLLGILIRCVIALFTRGYEVDMNCFEGWSNRMAEFGPSLFYSPDYFCDYPPGYMYVLWIVGALQKIFGIAFDSRLHWLLIKLPNILVDALAALLIFRVAEKKANGETGLLLCAMYALNPAAILNSAAWGQIDASLTVLLMISMLLLTQGRWMWALPVYGVAILVKPQALMFAPLGLCALVMEVIEEIKEQKHPSKTIGRMLLSFLMLFGAMLLLSAPYLFQLHPELEPLTGPFRPIVWLINLYAKTLSSYPHITINACNLYQLLDMNWRELELVPGWQIFGWIMMGLSYVYAGFLYVKAKDKGKLFMIAALLLAIVFCFAPKMHERYLFPALALLLLAYAKDMDCRILIAFVVLSFTQFTNGSLVLRSEHLQSSEQVLNATISIGNLLTAGLLCWTAWDLCVSGREMAITRRYQSNAEKQNAEEEVRKAQFADQIFKPRDYRLNLRLRDWVLMIALTLGYAALAFINLGTIEAPVTEWVSSAPGEQVTFDLGEVREFHMTYYGGICNQNFKVQLSEDSNVWSKEYFAEYREGTIFRWLWYRPLVEDPASDSGFSPADRGNKYPKQTARYVRLTMLSRGLRLHEVAFLGEDGNPLPISTIQVAHSADVASDAKLLIDEQDTVPPYPSYLNGTYFDEIYHARTGYELTQFMHNYEWTHPPLGKELIALGISLFGMNPFGWRFMGTLFGVLMVPLMYLLAKLLVKRTSLAFVASFLLAVDCMHFTQTRIATIDSFAVFFIMLMYLFMLRYFLMSFYHVRLWRTLVPLLLCGIAMGCAIASKWIGLYSALGLAALLFTSLGMRWREYLFVKRNQTELEPQRKRVGQRIQKSFVKYLIITLICCVVFFIIIPGLIYYFSYYWQLAPDGNFSIEGIVDLQKGMYGYHAGLAYDDHAFKSPWYQWPFIAKPMWYYTGDDFMPAGWASSISCMGNPIVFWGGFVALLFVIFKLFSDRRLDRRYLFVLVGFLSQYLPWILVPRSTFIYHYFASVPFIILATVLLFDWLRKRSVFAYKLIAPIYCILALMMFGFFYPVCSGLPVPTWFARNLKWFNWINYYSY